MWRRVASVGLALSLAFLFFFRPARWLSCVLVSPSPAGVLGSWLLSAFRWSMICLVTGWLAARVRRPEANVNWKVTSDSAHEGRAAQVRIGIACFAATYLLSFPVSCVLLPSKAALAGQATLKSWQLLTPSFLFLAAGSLLDIASTFAAACWEEVYWRGYLQRVVSEQVSPAGGIWASAVFFGLGHAFSRPEWGWLDVLNALLSGFLLCLTYIETRSLLAVTVAHCLMNLWWDIPFILYRSGSKSWAYDFMLILGVCLVAISVMMLRKEFARLVRASWMAMRGDWQSTVGGFAIAILGLAFSWCQAYLMRWSGHWLPLALAIVGLAPLAASRGWKTGNAAMLG